MSVTSKRRKQQQQQSVELSELQESIEELFKRYEKKLREQTGAFQAPLGIGSVVKLEEIPKILKIYRDLHTPVLFVGPPGIGKTETIMNYARELAEREGKQFIDITAQPERAELVLKYPRDYFVVAYVPVSTVQPEDIVGIPVKRRLRLGPELERWIIHYALPVWASVLTHPEVSGILFLDELLNLIDMPRLKTILMQILGPERRLGTYSLSPEIQIAAAANPPEQSAIAEKLPAPIVSRVGIYEVEPPSLRSWIEYMYRKYGEEWLREVAAFLHAFPQYFIAAQIPAETLEPYPTPRTWTIAARAMWRALKEGMSDLLERIASAHLGKDIAQALLTFLSQPVPSVREVLDNPDIIRKLVEEKKLDAALLALFNVARFIADNIEEVVKNEKMLEKIIKLMEKLLETGNPILFGMFIFALKSELLKKQKGINSFWKFLSALSPEWRTRLLQLIRSFI